MSRASRGSSPLRPVSSSIGHPECRRVPSCCHFAARTRQLEPTNCPRSPWRAPKTTNRAPPATTTSPHRRAHFFVPNLALRTKAKPEQATPLPPSEHFFSMRSRKPPAPQRSRNQKQNREQNPLPMPPRTAARRLPSCDWQRFQRHFRRHFRHRFRAPLHRAAALHAAFSTAPGGQACPHRRDVWKHSA